MIELPERYNASVLLDRNLEAGRAEKVAIFCEGEEVTYGELARRVNRFADALGELGVRQEERVLLFLNDTPAFPVAFFGAIRLGAVPIPVNTLLRADEYRFFVENSRARAVVCDAAHHDTMREALRGYGERVDVIVANGDAGEAHSMQALLDSGRDEFSPADTHRDDMAFWLYSSGSTGKPKGAVHLQHDIIFTCETYAKNILKATEEDKFFSASKLFHAYGLGNGVTFPYWAGATSVLYPGRPLPAEILRVAQETRPTLFFAVPTLYNAILNHEGAGDYDLSSVRNGVSAAESLPASIWRRWKDMFGFEILDGIGSTEMLHIFISNAPGEVKPGSSGRPVPGYEAKVLDEDERPVGTDEAGNLYVKGDSAAAFYWRSHEKTKATMRGEWLFAGDWYRVDKDGYYWYEGRADDMIKVSGLWVSPVEVEATLGEHEKVLEAAAVGIEVDGLTRIRAHIILKEGVEPSDDLTTELQNWCKSKLKRYQFPHFVEYVDELPKTVTGKIQRFKLRAEPEPRATVPKQADELA
ncbi:benzoate-CoA ligase family [Rubrobacter radiotolerans]|uniref:Benzoate-CoA ligase family n=1 Tax=Rubrobacter radiotolerans TaxID=42256 RepID=A0A023X428_RUBRA|nr:benzoate-CoA ligase family protein [Rubrobacter radiotolerans]AHY46956.1 benzoate-CoA ligase family [Rubrobacter radiotolerans]MDX5894362.1 benzoate-CoA ligase family protein [Rubrobacter radiotolerans]SMC05823.1 benzoate-CoA ligase [Rubrobacter radiotolerans DSM 5868]